MSDESVRRPPFSDCSAFTLLQYIVWLCIDSSNSYLHRVAFSASPSSAEAADGRKREVRFFRKFPAEKPRVPFRQTYYRTECR